MTERVQYLLGSISNGKVGRRAAMLLLYFIAGVALASAPIFGITYPLGFALIAAAPTGSVAASCAGVVLGFLLPTNDADALRCAATAIAVGGIKWALCDFKRVSESMFFPSGAALAGVLLTGAVVDAAAGASVWYDILWLGAEGLLAASGAYFLAGGFSAARALRDSGGRIFDRPAQNRGALCSRDVCCILVSAAIFAIPLCRLNIAGFSPAIAAVMVITLAAAGKYGVSGGAVSGIALGCILAAATGQYALSGICTAAGLIAALFAPAGAFASAAAFSATCAMCSLGTGAVNVFFLAEALIACAVYPPLSRKILAVLPEKSPPKRKAAPKLGNDDLAMRLKSAADGLAGVSGTVCEVADRLDKIDRPEAEQVCRSAAKAVCEGCAIQSYCWQSARDATVRGMTELANVLRRDGALRRENAPEIMRQRCAKWHELSSELNRRYADFAAKERARLRVAQVRSVVAEQMGGVSELLYELADEMCESDDVCPLLAARLADMLTEYGMRVLSAKCVMSEQGQLSGAIELAADDSLLDEEDIAELAADCLQMALEARMDISDGIACVSLTQIPPLVADFGAAQHRRGGESLCGDAYEALELGGSAVFMISDGMGSGGRAAVDAAMTCGLLSRLLRAGFGIHGALRVVNSAMLVRSDDESLATADCMRLNLFSGEAVFTKSGAAQSYVRHGDMVRRVEVQSLPLGIMREADCGDRSLTLEDGDIAVMVSDGAAGEDGDWIGRELMAFDGEDTRKFARNLVSLASSQYQPGEDDDITVLVVAVRAA